MSHIRILPDSVANKIAAGEVVERPASVVKELVENALDAGAHRIDVHVEAGGKRLIRIEDDGCGMNRDDALLAFERHSTSKIHCVEDLFEVTTLGFRGEALPSVAAVSRVLLETRHASESAGVQVEMAGGRLRNVKEIGWPGGTRLQVCDLFYNTPARRKFLKSESTELGHIASFVTHYALAHPEKSFRLASFTHELLNAPPAGTFRERLYQVMGGQMLEQLVEMVPAERAMPVFGQGEGDAEESSATPAVKVRCFGFVSRPEVQKLNRNQIYFFVNRRLVRDRLILHAITESYRNIIPSGVFPVALVFLELPPSEVDVNVHPSKTEVRFRHSGFIHDFARDTIRGSLIAARPMAAFPSTQAWRRERRQPPDGVEAEVSEKISEDWKSGGPGPSSQPSTLAQRATWSSPAQGVDAAAELRLSPSRPDPETGLLPLETQAPEPALAATGPQSSPGAEILTPGEPALLRHSGIGACSAAEDDVRGPAAAGDDRFSAGEFPSHLRPLGQVRDSFIIATNDEGLWIIDQHVAHERVLFEQHLRTRRDKRAEGQPLLIPMVVELKSEQQAVFRDVAQELAASGFEAEPFGQRTIAIKTAPAGIRAEDAERLLLEILDGVGAEARRLSFDVLRYNIAASVACHAAVKANMALEHKKMQWLLSELEKTECPMSCPHGRPILLRYSLRDIQKAFKRI